MARKKIRNSREELLIKSQYTCNNINCKCWIYTETHRIRKNGPQKNRGTWDLHKNTMCQGQASIKHDCSLGSQLYKGSQPVSPPPPYALIPPMSCYLAIFSMVSSPRFTASPRHELFCVIN